MLSYWTSACSLDGEREREREGGVFIGLATHTKMSTPITKDAKDACVCVFWVCAGVAGAEQCPWGNVHLLSSASALESPAVRSHSTSSPQRPALPAWEEGAVWEHGILGGAVFPVWPFPSVPPKGGRVVGLPFLLLHHPLCVKVAHRKPAGEESKSKIEMKQRQKETTNERERKRKRRRCKREKGFFIFLCSIYAVPSRKMNVPEI